MGEAFITFLDELNNFLPRGMKDQVLNHEFKGNPSIKHIIESLGVPHTEIGQILVNDQSVNFSHQVHSGNTIIVYPASPEVDHLSGLFQTGKLTIEPCFILDNHLGKLAKYLRILGVDTLYENNYHDNQLEQIAVEYTRILLTRDRQLLMRKTIRYGYAVHSLIPDEQMIEVIRRFGLTKLLNPFHRCLQCNTTLDSVPKEDILPRLEPLTKKYFHEFHICSKCDRVYWKGSHYDRMVKLISKLVEKSGLDGAQSLP
jgi:uncharacterized protein with PIN domain